MENLLYRLILDGNIDELKKNMDSFDLNINYSDTKETPLMQAIFLKNIEVLKVLLENGSDPNVPDGGEWYPLHFAVQSELYEAVKLLIQYGANINQQDGTYGNTPISVAISKTKDLQTIKLLLENGADLNIANKHGITAANVAKRKKIIL